MEWDDDFYKSVSYIKLLTDLIGLRVWYIEFNDGSHFKIKLYEDAVNISKSGSMDNPDFSYLFHNKYNNRKKIEDILNLYEDFYGINSYRKINLPK